MERALLYFAAIAALAAQSRFRAEGRLVLVNAGVYDNGNRFHGELTKENFRLLDEGEEMRLESVAVQEVALSTVILLDVSRSMKESAGEAREALNRFLDKARPGDEFCLLAFSEPAPGDCEFERDAASIRARAANLDSGRGTALGDALLRAMAMVKRAHNARRAVLILSDGLDNSSAHRWDEVRRAAMETDAAMYAVSLPSWRERDGWKAARLEKLVEENGGRMLTAGSAKELPSILDRLEVRQQYVLAFVPPPGAEAKPWRSVQVKLQGPPARNLRVYWRRRYSVRAQ